jgi:hypothetical protein
VAIRIYKECMQRVDSATYFVARERAFCETGGFPAKIVSYPSLSNLLRGIGHSPGVVAVAGA